MCDVDESGVYSKDVLPDGILPKSSTGKAIRYARSNWKALNVYATDRRLTIDNNLNERSVRTLAIVRRSWQFIGSEAAGYSMTVLFTILGNAKRHHLEPFAYVRDLLVKLSFLCAEHGVALPGFTESSVLSGPDCRKLGVSIAEQLPEESLMALLPDRWAAANPDHVLTHRIEEARRAANRKRDDRQKPAGKSRPSRNPPDQAPDGLAGRLLSRRRHPQKPAPPRPPRRPIKRNQHPALIAGTIAPQKSRRPDNSTEHHYAPSDATGTPIAPTPSGTTC